MSRVVFTLFNPATGELGAQYAVLEADADANTPSGWARIEGRWDDATHFVYEGAAIERPVFGFSDQQIAADDTEAATFVLPVSPITLTIDGTAHEVTGPVAEFTAETLGTYSLTFSAFPYLDQTVTVHAI